MPPNSEPSSADIASVNQMLSGQPAPAELAPVAEPQLQPAPVTNQPSPTTQPTDPFASLFASEPASTEPVQPAQQPIEQPTPQPTQPTEPVQPTPQAQPQVAPTADYETYDEYMARVTASVPAAPSRPDAKNIDANDPDAIEGFFDELMKTAEQRFESNYSRKNAIQTAEKSAWDAAFSKYGSLRDNKPLRDTVHTIRMGYFQRGIALTPTQAADKLLESLGQERRAGAAEAAVVTTYEQVQPNSGGSGAPVQTNLDTTNILESVQVGGEAALAEILDAQIKAGRTW